ncbi:MAG: 2-C-methyl-D-erythritol 4-phosphate cytidylyltransferase [Proteobacteria bacterium]|nr:2-C-methyl-D-erythritol 4-phosphate cytidylyltransferase [Pseudomonadota bacterium]
MTSTPSSPRFYALVPAAGTGSRAGTAGPKQYEELAGRPLMAHTLAALAAVPELTATLVVLAPGDTRFAELGMAGEGVWTAFVGGASRAETVAAGLSALRAHGAGDGDWVLVHDAARCLLRPEWVGQLIAACQDDPVGGLLAQPLADTLKREADGRVQATVPRQHMWAAQTPQMFRLALLERALAGADAAVTDEASAVEALGLAPRLVAASAENFKVTYPADLALAARLLGYSSRAS